VLTALELAFAVTVLTVAVPWGLHRLLLTSAEEVWAAWPARAIGSVVFLTELTVCSLAGPGAAAWTGAALVGCIGLWSGRIAVRVRQHERASGGLQDPAPGDTTMAILEELLAHYRREGLRSEEGYRAYAMAAIRLAGDADEAGLYSSALRFVEEIDEARLDRNSCALRAASVAMYLLRSGDQAGARATLARIPRPAPRPVTERSLEAFDALLLALEGGAQEAEARARAALERKDGVRVPPMWKTVLAHALAGQGLRDEARNVLRELAASVPRALERISRHQGPASPIADALLGDESALPYR
jgi:hypothetical protein